LRVLSRLVVALTPNYNSSNTSTSLFVVPRKVLEDAYVSEPERDELFEEAETEYETGDPTEGVKEQPSIYSPDHSKGWVHPKSTSKPNSPSKMKSSSGNSSSGTLLSLYSESL
jgi:hypothetical protein